MIYIGIDPGEAKGKEGAIATYIPSEDYFDIRWCPQTRQAMVEVLTAYKYFCKTPEEIQVILEKAPKKMKVGSRILHPTVLYGNFQTWYGILATLNVLWNIKYDIVHPRTWQLILPKNKKLSTKERSMERALRLYPEARPFLTKYRGEKKYNASDAVNLMDYGRIKVWG